MFPKIHKSDRISFGYLKKKKNLKSDEDEEVSESEFDDTQTQVSDNVHSAGKNRPRHNVHNRHKHHKNDDEEFYALPFYFTKII